MTSSTETRETIQSPIRILVVDDSSFMRFTITKIFNEAPGLQVVAAAQNGEQALNLIPKLKPDVVTLDVEMPGMDGLTALREIMATCPCPVIMLSSLTSEGARETVQALTYGAVDFVAKPGARANIASILDETIGKIRRAAKAKVYTIPKTKNPDAFRTGSMKKTMTPLRAWDKVVVIGTSTGGPRALNMLIPQLPADLQAAIVIIQHMPSGFTRSLADRLDSLSNLAVKEAAIGDRLEVGKALLAPGGFHMALDANQQVTLNQNPPIHGVRPAVDVTMTSIANLYKASTVAVILTGMGVDGTYGASMVHKSGGTVIAEDESSCVVWGMPRSAVEAGVVDRVVPLNEIAAAIQQAVRA
jgi:two-component system, chemotaxis family, protein-glutamate methylesterase/glutaminase